MINTLTVDAAHVADLVELYRHEAGCGNVFGVHGLAALAAAFIDTPIGAELEKLEGIARREYRKAKGARL